MKIPCVCDAGYHSFTANEMVAVIGAFQRGELSVIRYSKGEISGIIPKCLAHSDFEAGTIFSGKCGVELADGTQCGNHRGHNEGRHGLKARGARKARGLRNVA